MAYKNLQELRDGCQRGDRIGPLVIGDGTATVWESVRGQVVPSLPVDGLLEQALDLLGIPHVPALTAQWRATFSA
jgi:hypothetical protein